MGMGHRLGRERSGPIADLLHCKRHQQGRVLCEEAVPLPLAPVPYADGCAGDSVRQAPVGDAEARLAVRAAFFMPLSLGGEGMTDELPSWRASSERPTNSFYRTGTHSVGPLCVYQHFKRMSSTSL